jgi:GNAT superfamily N-acetyltransferase
VHASRTGLGHERSRRVHRHERSGGGRHRRRASVPAYQLLGGGYLGFARAVTDRAIFAYLADVYVIEAYRGRGLARRWMDAVMAHPDLQRLRRFSLTTRDAEGLYRRYGFAPLAAPTRHMEISWPGMYTQDPSSRNGR